MKKLTTGIRTRHGYFTIVFRALLQLPIALYISQVERRKLEPATQNKFNIFVEGSFAQAILLIRVCMFRRKTTANLQVQIPEKRPWLCRKKQGPLLRKRAMAKHMVPYALMRLAWLQQEEKKAGSTATR